MIGSLKSRAVDCLNLVGLLPAARRIKAIAHEATGGVAGQAKVILGLTLHGLKTRGTINAYLSQHSTKALHLGCGQNPLVGFLNSDAFPQLPNVIYLDTSLRFPFKENTFDYVFSEHLIEHLAYQSGFYSLCESFRILKPGGIIRIATPDMAFLVDLYRPDKTELQRQYIDRAISRIKAPCLNFDTFVINNFVRAWGHQFIYDEKTLSAALELSGFRNISRCALHQSQHEFLQGLENIGRMPEGFLALETFVLEAQKPS